MPIDIISYSKLNKIILRQHAVNYQPNVQQPTRNLDTIYQNNYRTAIHVTVSIAGLSTGNSAVAEISSDGQNWITVSVFQNQGTTATLTGSFIVPKDWYYRIRTVEGTVSLASWTEYAIYLSISVGEQS